MFGLRAPELILIFLIVVLLFGANRIPKLGEALGKTIRGFRDATKDVEDAAKDVQKDVQKAAELPGRSASPSQAPAEEKKHA
jgi:sec-independent protein translocase protein TatA